MENVIHGQALVLLAHFSDRFFPLSPRMPDGTMIGALRLAHAWPYTIAND